VLRVSANFEVAWLWVEGGDEVLLEGGDDELIENIEDKAGLIRERWKDEGSVRFEPVEEQFAARKACEASGTLTSLWDDRRVFLK